MAGPTPDRSDSVTPDLLAAAMRSGLEQRRYVPRPAAVSLPQLGPPPAGCGDRVRQASLGAFDHPQPPERGLRKRFWRMLQELLGPLAAKQTHLHESTADSLDQLQHYLGIVAEQVNALNRTLSNGVLAGAVATNVRLNECLYDVYQLRQAMPDPVRSIEGLFLQTRLAPPPGRILVVGPVGLHALDLASLGFQVVVFGATQPTLTHPALEILDDVSLIPDGSFDGAVAFGGSGIIGEPLRPVRENLARTLKPGGAMIGSYPIRGTLPTPAEFAKSVAPFAVTELQYGTRAGHGWSLGTEPSEAAELVLWVGTPGR